MARTTNPFRWFDSSPEVIRLVVMMYVRYPLSLRGAMRICGAVTPHHIYEGAGLGRYLEVRTIGDVEQHLAAIRASAARAQSWIAAQSGDPLDLLRRMKFEPVGFRPIEDRPLNVIEQINQTWTYAVALSAARVLLELHPEARGFKVAPGAHMALPLDIMSEEPGLVGAETFAAVHPRNNGKLASDLAKLADRPETHRYVFFMSPRHPGAQRHSALERDGVQVWSVDV